MSRTEHTGQTRRHVIVISGPEWGHLAPAVELAVQLVRLEACDVSLVVSQSVAQLVLKCGLIPPECHTSLTLVPIHDGLPSGTEDNLAMNREQRISRHLMLNAHWDTVARIARTCQGLEGAQATESDFKICPLSVRRIDHIVVGMFVTRAANWFRDLGIPLSAFWSSSINSTLHTMRALKLYRESPSPATQASSMPHVPAVYEDKPMTPQFAKVFGGLVDAALACDQLLVNSFEELEGSQLAQLRELAAAHKTEVFPIGPVSLYGRIAPSPQTSAIEQHVRQWLDAQHAASRPVVYINHGGQVHLLPEQTAEIAQALRTISDRVSFVWSMRRPQQQGLPSDLAASFCVLNTTAGKQPWPSALPVLVTDWAAQTPVLAHPATKAFVTQAGWNSVVESIACAVPVIAWPIFADQFTNASLITALQLGVTVPGTVLGAARPVPCRAVCEAIAQVLGYGAREFVYNAIAQILGHGTRESVYHATAKRIQQMAEQAVRADDGSSAQSLRAAFATARDNP
ncbi:hypothetical protein RI367_005511 [Sorochytrium milnesiophthora]